MRIGYDTPILWRNIAIVLLGFSILFLAIAGSLHLSPPFSYMINLAEIFEVDGLVFGFTAILQLFYTSGSVRLPP